MTLGLEIKKIEKITKPNTKVYDFEVEDAHHYIFGDGIISHNSYIPMKKMGGGCLVSGTKIQTPNGLKEIENLKIGDYVSTLYGDNRVTETFVFDDKEVFELCFDNGTTIRCSGDHKFLVNGKWTTVYAMLDSAEAPETLNIEVADMEGDLDVYRQQIDQDRL